MMKNRRLKNNYYNNTLYNITSTDSLVKFFFFKPMTMVPGMYDITIYGNNFITCLFSATFAINNNNSRLFYFLFHMTKIS